MSDNTDVLESPASSASQALLAVIFRTIDGGSPSEFSWPGGREVCSEFLSH